MYMYIKQFLQTVPVILLFASLCSCAKGRKPIEERPQPSILWIITDDHRSDSLAYYKGLS